VTSVFRMKLIWISMKNSVLASCFVPLEFRSISEFCSPAVFSISVTSSPSCCYFGFGEPHFLLPAGQVLAQVLYFRCSEVLASARCSLPSS
jgi:hypothetical protein